MEPFLLLLAAFGVAFFVINLSTFLYPKDVRRHPDDPRDPE